MEAIQAMKRIFLPLVGAFVFLSVAVQAETKNPGAIVILAKATNVEFVVSLQDLHSSDPQPDSNTQTLHVGAVWKTRLEVVEVLSGSLDKPYVDVQLVALRKGYIANRQILVWLEMIDGEPTYRYWWPLQTYACVDKDFIEEHKLGDAFGDASDWKDDKCLEVSPLPSPEE
jgi:hypothetical protein